MKSFDVQGIALDVPREEAFAFIADPGYLPRWTSAFASATTRQAVLRTPRGEVRIKLEVKASAEQGTVDWKMTFPDGNVATAFSRIVEIDRARCVFSFILTPPPVPLEDLEGALEAQSRTLAGELANLKRILDHHG
ncbi:MAG TPA: SRPBCC family protein [Thermoanaerobaculia bacterium]|nr:SRPBCC family protein [Thermoanaerobaculia bacterium]